MDPDTSAKGAFIYGALTIALIAAVGMYDPFNRWLIGVAALLAGLSYLTQAVATVIADGNAPEWLHKVGMVLWASTVLIGISAVLYALSA